MLKVFIQLSGRQKLLAIYPNWKPYKLEDVSKAFLDSSIPIPYWGIYEHIEDRIIAIQNYYLNEELKESLSINEKQIPKSKV